MAKYRITGKKNYTEHFWNRGQYFKVRFDENGYAYTEEEAVAEYYRNRDFPNDVPHDSETGGYSVWKMSE